MAFVCGIDEAGRGCLCGSMYVAGVACDEAVAARLKAIGVKDSKKLAKKRRFEILGALKALESSGEICAVVIEKSAVDIDERGISACIKEAIESIAARFCAWIDERGLGAGFGVDSGAGFSADSSVVDFDTRADFVKVDSSAGFAKVDSGKNPNIDLFSYYENLDSRANPKSSASAKVDSKLADSGLADSSAVDFGELDSSAIDSSAPESKIAPQSQSTTAHKNSERFRIYMDGNSTFGARIPARLQLETIIKGDDLVAQISSASIYAKCAKDAQMLELDARYPQYGLKDNAGYGTKSHIDALKALGTTPHHRQTFRWDK
ncbi:hypothetical protein BKN38_07750 [Helicobacter sp. CLO-3]|uniref:ribonuclease HII n=1 Tax=unclassified Helicobacter TaxID=2593540 RepID=UPI0008058C16|nr:MULTISPECIES: ribonuclease HII [unclassified Helicobacter]OBV28362.1 hypothetical protein BA723_09705 [Helicobacter sp. CLO-3]OHU82038.1 hypothetical protein BKN38_07750 [Helicobacter sp. CLO-3]